MVPTYSRWTNTAGQTMNAYKYQKFLEGLNNLRGIQAALDDCVDTSGVSVFAGGGGVSLLSV